jgi:hypothetical protein
MITMTEMVASVREHKGEQWEANMRAMLGKKVAVTINWGEASSHGEPVVVRGILHGFSQDGEVTIRPEGEFMHWCWPNLETRLVELS